ncbi:MAG TPA: DUF3419 family protein, partial [Acidimicrobiales bacterium]|nr:DUF3419 family protein [Acidimicrobiales bacterium]
LCQNPRRLISIDSNPAQTALLELKLAAIATLDHEAFFDIFAARRPSRVLSVYRPRLRPLLSERAQEFWDDSLDFGGASPIVVTVGNTTSPIDAALHL